MTIAELTTKISELFDTTMAFIGNLQAWWILVALAITPIALLTAIAHYADHDDVEYRG